MRTCSITPKERESIVAAVKLVVTTSLDSINRGDILLRKLKLLKIIKDLSMWFCDIDAECARRINDEVDIQGRKIFVDSKACEFRNNTITWSQEEGLEELFESLLEKSDNLFYRTGFRLNFIGITGLYSKNCM